MRVRVPEKGLHQQDLVLKVIRKAVIIEAIRLDDITNKEEDDNNDKHHRG